MTGKVNSKRFLYPLKKMGSIYNKEMISMK